MDEQKLHELMGGCLQDLGGAFSVPLVQIGEKLGIYEALNEKGPCTVAELSAATGVAERYMREWLSAQAASNYVTYDAEADKFSMSPEQAFVFADRSSPFYLAPAFASAAVFQQNEPKVLQAFKTGEGVAWGDQSECLSCAVAKFFRPGYENHLVQAWLPSLDGMVEKLERGARVADIGCGHGLTTTIMAKAFPNSEFVGLDFHAPSIEAARNHAKEQGVSNVSFETKNAKDVSGTFDLATIFDCLHDMGDPVGAMQQIRESLSEQGACMIVEPMAGDNSEAESESRKSTVLQRVDHGVCADVACSGKRSRARGAGWSGATQASDRG